jgi:hypothetical protein
MNESRRFIYVLRLDIRFYYYGWTLSIGDDFHSRYIILNFDRASVVQTAVLEMSEQFVLILFNPAREFFTQFARYNGNWMRILKINNFLSMEKNHLTVHVDITINIRVQNLFLSTATKQLHLNLISKLILGFALLLAKHNKERCHVKILIPYPYRLSSPLLSSSKTLSKHTLSTPMFWFCFHSIRGAVRICGTACRAILELTNRAHLYNSFGLTD